jgi:hypothetical protein
MRDGPTNVAHAESVPKLMASVRKLTAEIQVFYHQEALLLDDNYFGG